MTKEITIYNKLFNVKKEGIKLQRDTKAFNYKYATLDQIQEKLGPILEKETLLVTHSIIEGNVVTQVTDVSTGQNIQSSIPLTVGTKPQDKGSEITYYRRYNLVCLFDLEVEDDDGKKAQESKEEKARLNVGSPNWNKCIGKLVPIEKVKQHFQISKANETIYIDELSKQGKK